MKRRISNFIYFLILFVLSVQFVAAEPCREVVGYFAGWKWYKRNKLVNPESIDYSKFTIINYAFFKPLENGTVTEGDSWADHIILKGKLKKVNGNMVNDPSSSLVFKAHSHGVKVVGSVGGWSWSSVFPGIAADPVKRMQFAASCVDIIEKYNLDGIDIDWEYPGHKAHNGSAADKQNFTLLLQTIRNSLNAYEKISGRKMLLTAAFGPAPNHMEQIEWEKVTPLLDIIHMMTYNYYGAWDKTANHNCPLFKPLKANAAYNIDATLKTLNEIYNVPLSKITLGLAFYGRSVIMNNESGLFDTSTGRPDDVTFPEEKGTPSYYNILKHSDLYSENWDDIAKVPYLTGQNGLSSFVSFDNPESISIKAQYAVQANLRGVVIWDISGDCIESFPGSGIISETPLCDAVYKVFCNTSEFTGITVLQPEAGLTAYPNPFKAELEIKWNQNVPVSELKVMNAGGQIVFQASTGLEGIMKLNTSLWAPGIYFVNLYSSGKMNLVKVLKI